LSTSRVWAAGGLVGEMIKPKKADHLIGGFGQSRIRGTEQARHHAALVFLSGKNEIFAHGQFWKNLQQLECAADAEAIEIGGPKAGHHPAVVLHLAIARRQPAENAVEERRLAATVRSDQSEDFAPPEPQSSPHRRPRCRQNSS
jgi:hypothetical protein